MELLRRQLLHIVMTAVALPALSSMARAQTDRRAVNLLVGFAAGSSVDIIARLLAEQLNKAQGLTMIVQNLPGAGTLIATEAAARADPNSNTLLITSPPFVINTHLRKLNYDPLTSFEPICDLLHTPTFIVVGLLGFISAARDISTVVLLGSSQSRTMALLALDYAFGGQFERGAVVAFLTSLVVIIIALIAHVVGSKVGIGGER